MSGLLALFDDVAAIAKLAASQLDDVAAQASKAGTKAAGVVIDDAAVTPKYVTGLPAARELPIVWKIARASFFNKLVILLPVALLLDAFLPWLLTPLLMIGGAYLCFEGAEKVWHLIVPHKDHGPQEATTLEAAHLEEQRVKGAIKTDFILSAEIMTISLSQIEIDTLWIQAAALAAVAIGITALVYGAVALLVKADDLGILLTAKGRFALTRSLGRGIVKSMPAVMGVIATVGTVAMLWVGGSIIVHGVHDLGWHLPYEQIKHIAMAASEAIGSAQGFVTWAVTAGLDGVVGLATGLVLIPIVNRAVVPVTGWLFPEKA
ncbi:putative DNA repair protein MutK [Roseovarius sp. MBR-51]